MRHQDVVYGDVAITDTLALDIIESPSFQRLKNVDMAWYFEVFYPWSAHSRFEHSIWVYTLLNTYRASTEEQIAGLIHDVSHWAFSHCLDYVFDEGSQKEQSHQDNIFETFIKTTDIPQILERHKIDLDFVLDDKNFPLKETLLPDLCADRIDYILRWAIHYANNPRQEMQKILSHLFIHEKKRVFDNAEYAQKFAELFKEINDVYYSDITTAVMFQTTGDVLKYAIQKQYITKADLYTTDKEVLQKILPYIDLDEELALRWERMNNKIPYKNSPSDFDNHVFCKNRVVDPLFLEWDKIKRVSDISPKWKEIIDSVQPKEYFLKFEK